ncbi:MAG: hypothetical protein JNK45_18930 [Myxococcales bacterium]|nr:hypothetical protein [Myxococcales bacterium]
MHEPGTELWWESVRRLGVSRDDVPGFDDHDGTPADLDPHDIIVFESTPAKHIVTYMLAAYHVPDYAAMMYVPHRWEDAGRSLKEWTVTAYAWMIDEGSARQREAALYSLWVDFFEVPKRAAFVFPRLMRQVRQRDELLAASGPVPWEHKRAAYQAAALEPARHASLARALIGSFYDAYGSVEPVEALALFRSIAIEDAAVREALESILFTPTRWRVVGLVTVDEADARWRRWLPEDAGPSFLVEIVPVDSARWVRGSELLYGDRWLGRLLHWCFPFDTTIRHRREAVPHDGPAAMLCRLEGYVDAVRAALGQVVEAWPPGLAPGGQ